MLEVVLRGASRHGIRRVDMDDRACVETAKSRAGGVLAYSQETEGNGPDKFEDGNSSCSHD